MVVGVGSGLWTSVRAGRANSSPIEVVYASPAAFRAALRQNPARLLLDLRPIHVAEVRPRGDTRTFLREIGRAPGISASRVTVQRTAADPVQALELVQPLAGGAYEWQVHATRIDQVPAAVIAAARDITIAVIDTGADLSDSDLAGRVAATYDVRSGGHVVTDESGHGTFVASLITGSGVNGAITGFGGAARLLVVKASSSSGFSELDIAAGILYSVHHGARIINLSVAGRTRSPVEEAAIQYATKHDVLVVAAAGNDALNGDPPEYPAALLQPEGSNGVGGLGLAVGASDLQGNRAPFSESGSFVSLAAPGVSVLGAVSSRSSIAQPSAGRYGFASGTSFAAPEVAGAAALVWAADPRLSAQQVAGILKQTASGHGSWTPNLGYGVIDVAAAVDWATRSAEGVTSRGSGRSLSDP